MIIEMFNGWYFFWVLLLSGITAALYFLLRNRSYALQRTVLFLLLAIGLVLHFMIMGFILLNQMLQSELGYIPLRSRYEFFEIGYKNSSYI